MSIARTIAKPRVKEGHTTKLARGRKEETTVEILDSVPVSFNIMEMIHVKRVLLSLVAE